MDVLVDDTSQHAQIRVLQKLEACYPSVLENLLDDVASSLIPHRNCFYCEP